MNDLKERGMDKVLKPILWDEFIGEGLIFYREENKSFWHWGDVRMVVKIGYYWTDVIAGDVLPLPKGGSWFQN
jgi:hypothetical protein